MGITRSAGLSGTRTLAVAGGDSGTEYLNLIAPSEVAPPAFLVTG